MEFAIIIMLVAILVLLAVIFYLQVIVRLNQIQINILIERVLKNGTRKSDSKN